MTTPMPWSMNSPSPMSGAGVDLDAGGEAAEVRDDARDHRDAAEVEGVGEAVQLARVEARVREHDLGRAAGGRIALADGVDIALDGLEYGHEDERPPPCLLLGRLSALGSGLR